MNEGSELDGFQNEGFWVEIYEMENDFYNDVSVDVLKSKLVALRIELIHLNIDTEAHKHTLAQTHTQTYTYVSTHTHIRKNANTHTQACTHTYASMHTHSYTLHSKKLLKV